LSSSKKTHIPENFTGSKGKMEISSQPAACSKIKIAPENSLPAASLKKKGPGQPEIESPGAWAAFVTPLVV